MQEKFRDRYAKYLEGHEEALVQLPEREVSLNLSHMEVDKRHLEVHDLLHAYIDDGNKSERSVHMRSLFSSKASVAGTTKTASQKRLSRRSSRNSTVSLAKSDRLSEARVQAELAKANIEQQRALQEAQQRKLSSGARQRHVNRSSSKGKLLEEQSRRWSSEAARRQFELDEQQREAAREAARQQMDFDEQKRLRDEELKTKGYPAPPAGKKKRNVSRTELEEEIGNAASVKSIRKPAC